MKKKLLVLLSTGIVSLGTTAVVCTNVAKNGNALDQFGVSEENIVWQHYSQVTSTTESIGYREYWTNCTDHRVVFEEPQTGTITEGSTASSDILTYLGTKYDDPRFVAKKGTVAIDTINSTKWVSQTYDGQGLNKFTTGVDGQSNPGGLYADFNNYVYTDWTSAKVGVDATYILPDNADIRRVNTITLTYYSYQPVAPVTVVMKAVDVNNNKVTILEKTVTHCAGPVTETIVFDSINFKKLFVSTKGFVEGGNGRSHFLMKDVLLSYTNVEPAPKGDIDISTTDKTFWSCTAKESATNKIVVGTGPYWGAAEGSGAYLTLLDYQYSDWNADADGLTATYTASEAKTVNTLKFIYYLNKDTVFKASSLTLKISIVGGGKTTLIDTLKFEKNTATFGAVIDYSKTFSDLTFEKLQLEVFVDEAKGFSGDTAIFLKEMAVKYIA